MEPTTLLAWLEQREALWLAACGVFFLCAAGAYYIYHMAKIATVRHKATVGNKRQPDPVVLERIAEVHKSVEDNFAKLAGQHEALSRKIDDVATTANESKRVSEDNAAKIAEVITQNRDFRGWVRATVEGVQGRLAGHDTSIEVLRERTSRPPGGDD